MEDKSALTQDELENIYNAMFGGDSDAFLSAMDEAGPEKRYAMYQEIVAARITTPACLGIIHWMVDAELEEKDRADIEFAVSEILKIVVGQLTSAIEGGDFISQMASRVLEFSGGEE